MIVAAAATARRIPLRTACQSRLLLASQSLFNHDVSSLKLDNSCASRFGAQRHMSDLPYHIIINMPALSPTMEAGTISKWNVEEGESFSAGDSLAEIETDKATIDFEAQDDGVVAKHLVQPGGNEIKVGVPIMVTVEEPEDVAAFKDFKLEDQPESAEEEKPAAAAETPEPKEEAEAPASPPKEEAKTPASPPKEEKAAPSPPPPSPTPQPPPAAPPAEETSTAAPPAATPAAPTVGPYWGNLAGVRSPIAKTLSAEQKKYVKMYGSTGQIPL